jgi:choline dehydrogenase
VAPRHHGRMDSFDFIIVGAGSAGCVLANRLSENGRFTVLLLEAGGSDMNLFVQMPLGYGKTFYNPDVNWMYAAEADPGLNGQRDHWPRGKVLGGSSSINAMVWIRGHREDYEDWKRAGNTGWGWDDVLPAYRAIEDNEAGGDEWRGAGGPLHVSDTFSKVHPLTHRWIEACQATGIPFNRDFNGADQEGCGTYQLTAKDGLRMSAAKAFLRPALRRRNLRVAIRAHVTRILFDGKRATGVVYRQHGSDKQALARREVILAGGSVNSPQLLQLSGIGPGEVLQRFGIPPIVHNANVGRHMEDHLGLNYTWRMNAPTLNDVLRPWWGKLKTGLQWVLFRSGPLSLSINHGGGFFRTDPSLPRPNMQLYMQAFSTLLPKAGERPILDPDPYSGMSIGLSNCRPTARGYLELASPDPFTQPRIVPNAYGTAHDVREMLAAVKMLRRIAAQEPLASLVAEELRPGPSIQSDDELVQDFKQRSGTVYHPSCTCRMGPDPATSVVDPRLRVHGVDALRVIDASAFPSLIAGNTNAPAILMGWKGAQMVLEDQDKSS